MRVKTDLFKRLRKKGYLMVDYTLLKALGPTVAIVLERLLTEYQHAISNGLMRENDTFCIDGDEIVFHLGISEKDLIDALNKCIDLELISISECNGMYFVKINEDEIVDFEKTAEVENDYKRWDFYLYTVQSRIDNFDT